MAALTLGVLAATAFANQPDVLFPYYMPPAECAHGCAAWEGNPHIVAEAIPLAAASTCAIPGKVTGTNKNASGAWAGPFCYCADAGGKATPQAEYCRNPFGVPEQINLQLASGDTVVVAFVTYEAEKPTRPPSAKFGPKGGAMATVTGVTHWYEELDGATKDGPHTGRNFSMHFVKLGGLKPRTDYQYSVAGGGGVMKWSKVLGFRSSYTAADGGVTRVGIFGDMAVTEFNAVGNLAADCAAGTIDAFLMMGDHAYDLGMVDDHRGDAYMNCIAPATASCPWIPVIGNHEASDGGHYNRYLNQTWGEAYANPAVASTADSALGHLLTKGTLFGASSHGTRPSGTSRYFSVDVGLIHFVALDLNAAENGTAPGTRVIGLDKGQLAWLDQDLAAARANDKAVPWIVVTSHFPIYLSPAVKPGEAGAAAAAEHAAASAQYYESPEAEAAADDDRYRSCAANGEPADCPTVGELMAEKASALEPLFIKYGVDLYGAGHSHLYGVTWPMVNGKATQKDYVNPKGTVYLTEGNGGVPGAPGLVNAFTKPTLPYGRIGGLGGAYGRLITSNASVLTYEHVFNNGNHGAGAVGETWAIAKTKTA